MGKGALAMKTVACVLKSGGWRNRSMRVEYTPAQVRWLRDMVARHLRVPHRFVCLTDVPVQGVDTLPLRDGLPGWWSKMELFREFDDAFYLDLDTVLVGDITPLVTHAHRFTVLRNLSSKADGRIGSGLMAWHGDCSHLYAAFMADAQRHMAECTTSAKWGDQGFIQHQQAAHGGWDCFQDLWPGAVASYKIDHIAALGLRPAHKIICFHGKPKPWEVRHRWVPRLETHA